MRILTPCLIMLGTLVWPSMGLADISFNNGAWTTSFNYGRECSKESPNSGVGDKPGTASCEAISTDGIDWTDSTPLPHDRGGEYTEAVVAANNPNGGGGNGFRVWVQGGGADNVMTPPVDVIFPNQEPEVWVRWYMRYQTGFDYGANGPTWDKWIYSRWPTQANKWVIIEPSQGGFGIFPKGNGTDIETKALNWTDIFGRTSDGLFHMVEFHIKFDTNGQSDGLPANGIAQMWLDGNLVIDDHAFNMSAGNASARLGMKYFEVKGNQKAPKFSGVKYVDFDDFAIWKTTPPNTDAHGNPWIGPINGYSGASSLAKPKSPAPVGVSFYDPIEDNNFTSRGWHDKTSMLAN